MTMFTLSGQSSYGLRIGAGIGYQEKQSMIGIERQMSNNMSLLAQFQTNENESNMRLGFRYKLVNFKDKVSLKIGADIGRTLFESYNQEYRPNPYFFSPAIEMDIKLSNRWSLLGTFSFGKRPSLGLGASYKF